MNTDTAQRNDLTTTSPSSKQEARSALSRRKLLEATIHTIRIKGVAKLNVRAICKEAGYEFMRLYYTPANAMLNFREHPNNERVVLEECVDCLREGQHDGTIHPGIDLDEAHLEIAMIATGVMFYWCVFEGKLDAEGLLDQHLKSYLATLEA